MIIKMTLTLWLIEIILFIIQIQLSGKEDIAICELFQWFIGIVAVAFTFLCIWY